MKRLFIFVFSIIFLAGCIPHRRVYNALHEATITSGQVLIQVYLRVYDFAESADGVDVLCADLLKKHKDEIEAGTYTEEQLKADCTEIIYDFERKFDKALTVAADSLETLESSLEVYKQATDKDAQFKKIVDCLSEAIKALNNIVTLLKDCDVPVPQKLIDYIRSLEGIANSVEAA